MEAWRPIEGFPRYAVSDEGRFFSWISGRYLSVYIHKTKRNPGGRKEICLYSHFAPQHSALRSAARLVLGAFRGPCPHGSVLIFKDGNSMNIALSNLMWGTKTERKTRDYDNRRPHTITSRYFKKVAAKQFYEATTPKARG